MTMPLTGSHSADVAFWLECGPHGRIEIARLTRRRVFPMQPVFIPPGEAELVISVDGKQFRQRVKLLEGLSPTRLSALALPVDDAAPF
jgi:hypothetical protein